MLWSSFQTDPGQLVELKDVDALHESILRTQSPSSKDHQVVLVLDHGMVIPGVWWFALGLNLVPIELELIAIFSEFENVQSVGCFALDDASEYVISFNLNRFFSLFPDDSRNLVQRNNILIFPLTVHNEAAFATNDMG